MEKSYVPIPFGTALVAFDAFAIIGCRLKGFRFAGVDLLPGAIGLVGWCRDCRYFGAASRRTD